MWKHLQAVGVIILGFVAFLWYANASQNAADRQITVTRQNNTYLRTQACILSVPLATRTAEYIEECYNKAEKANGIKVDHYGVNK